jgi:hypothetical protein
VLTSKINPQPASNASRPADKIPEITEKQPLGSVDNLMNLGIGVAGIPLNGVTL